MQLKDVFMQLKDVFDFRQKEFFRHAESHPKYLVVKT